VSRAILHSHRTQPEAESTVSVGICVATYRRPRGLRRLLNSLAEMHRVPGVHPFVVVVDNDPEQPGHAVVEAARAQGFPYPIYYEVEPERNIALARNRGVAVASRLEPEWLAFVDDDEVVCPRWLGALLEVADRHSADVVSGSIRHSCPEGTPRWIDRGKFFGQNEQRTGLQLDLAHTGNVLVARRLMGGAPFDTRFGLSGGSDSHLFMRLRRQGAQIVSAGDAVTYEQIPASRANAGWVLRRAFRVGNTAILCERQMDHGGRPATRLAKATLRAMLGVAMLPAVVIGGRAAALGAAWNVVYGLGAWAGVFGYRYTEYSRVHGE